MLNVSFATYLDCERRPHKAASKQKGEVAMKRYIIEREIPGVGSMTGPQLEQAAATSNDALAKLSGKAQWIQSFVADNKTFCVYLAENEAAVQEHARLSGFPANKVTEISGIIDPTTAGK
jgi:hypothetical protein